MMPHNEFVSLDPVQEPDPYMFGLADHDTLDELYGREW
jgi:hypothetical protein